MIPREIVEKTHPLRNMVLKLGIWFVAILFAGCAPYQMGTRSLYPADVQTVYVPMFKSDSYRRNLAERLTEAVVKHIEANTPYKVVGPAEADSVLTGHISSETKRVLVETNTDEGRELQANLVVQVDWKTRNDQLLFADGVDLPRNAVQIGQTASLVPEVGISIVVAQQQAIEKLAAQIVAMMEAPW